MGGKITLFNACRGKGIESASPVSEHSSNTPESLGPCLDILENPSGYRYFSPEEENISLNNLQYLKSPLPRTGNPAKS
jgi:hypothetical protein